MPTAAERAERWPDRIATAVMLAATFVAAMVVATVGLSLCGVHIFG